MLSQFKNELKSNVYLTLFLLFSFCKRLNFYKFQACIDDNLDMVEFLVSRGADVNRGDNEGWTPLHATASCGFLSIARYIIMSNKSLEESYSSSYIRIQILDLLNALTIDWILAKIDSEGYMQYRLYQYYYLYGQSVCSKRIVINRMPRNFLLFYQFTFSIKLKYI